MGQRAKGPNQTLTPYTLQDQVTTRATCVSVWRRRGMPRAVRGLSTTSTRHGHCWSISKHQGPCGIRQFQAGQPAGRQAGHQAGHRQVAGWMHMRPPPSLKQGLPWPASKHRRGQLPSFSSAPTRERPQICSHNAPGLPLRPLAVTHTQAATLPLPRLCLVPHATDLRLSTSPSLPERVNHRQR